MSKTTTKNTAPPAVTAPAAPAPELPALQTLPRFKAATAHDVVHPVTGTRFTREADMPHEDDNWCQNQVATRWLTRTV